MTHIQPKWCQKKKKETRTNSHCRLHGTPSIALNQSATTLDNWQSGYVRRLGVPTMTNRSSALRTTLLTFPRLRGSAYRRSLHVFSLGIHFYNFICFKNIQVCVPCMYITDWIHKITKTRTRIVFACFEILKSWKKAQNSFILLSSFLVLCNYR